MKHNKDIEQTKGVKPVPPSEKPWSYHFMMLIALWALATGLWARLYNLGFPSKQVFDEVHFPVFARNYVEGIPVFDVHPPLGKFLLAPSIALLGDTPFAWRLMPALFGCALLGLGVVVGRHYLKGRLGALLLATFIASETIFIAYSRVGLLDGILAFFILATVLAAWRIERKRQVIWPAVLLGLAVSIKWLALGVIVPLGYILWHKKLLKPFLASLGIPLAIYLLIVYAGQVISGGYGVDDPSWQGWHGMWEWHRQASAHHTSEDVAEHPYESSWLSWPLMLRPVLFFYETDAAGRVLVISAIGNPVLWWSSTLAIVCAFYEVARRKVVDKEPVADHPLVPILLGYVAFLLPWALVGRFTLLYHYLPSYIFALLALAYGLCQLWKYRPWVVVAFTACAVATTLFYLPMVTAWPISEESLRQRLWLESWL